MKYKITYCLLGVLILLSADIFAQEKAETDTLEPTGLILLGKHDEGKNILRWAPRNYALWQIANTGGYMIDRYEFGKNGIKLESHLRLTPTPLKPLTIEQWKAQFKPENKMAAIAVQTLYGSTVKGEAEGVFGDIAEQYMQQQNLFGFGMLVADASKDIATGMALRFEDTNIEVGKNYAYFIFALSQIDNVQTDTTLLVLRNDKRYQIPTVHSLKAIEGEHEIMLKWSSIENIYSPSGYFIERSTDGGRNFFRLNEMPHIAMSNASDSLGYIHDKEVSFMVNLENNYQPYQYRVLAFNAFGEMSTEGNIITAMGRDKTPPPQPRLKNPQEMGATMILTWDMPDNSEPLQGFLVGHSNYAEGPFFAIHNELLSPSERSWADEKAKTRTENYYIVSAIDTAGNISNSLPVYSKFIDSIPPAKPIGLHGIIDTSGLMTLTWTPNEEADLMGYNIWFANAEGHEFTQINSTALTTDTFTQILELHTLTEEIYYQVVALDINFNPSDRSDILRVKKPDIIAPVSPQIHAVNASDKGILISWNNSPSKDIVSHRINRRKAGHTRWETMTEISDLAQTSWIDQTAEATVLYEYQIIGKDDDNLWSLPSNAVTGRVFHASKKEGISQLIGEHDKESNLIKLSWEHSISGDFTFYLYRAQEDGKLRLYKSFTADETEFLDTQVSENTRYRYAVKVIYSSGSISDLSKEVEIVF